MTDLPLLDYARRARDHGMAVAVDHADSVEHGWSERAYLWVAQYAQTHHQFVSEECTAAAASAGFQSPTDPRAWGHPFRKAARAGIIKRVGYGVSARRHLSPTPLWESQTYQRSA